MDKFDKKVKKVMREDKSGNAVNDGMEYGKRPDGSSKGDGFFGKLNRPDGSVSTEISIGVGMNGKEVNIPLIVPTLNKKELNYLLSTDVKAKDFFNKMPPSIMEKAYEHANTRIKSGISPFARPNEIVKPPAE
jgi:hypothetical protein